MKDSFANLEVNRLQADLSKQATLKSRNAQPNVTIVEYFIYQSSLNFNSYLNVIERRSQYWIICPAQTDLSLSKTNDGWKK
jgi:hypothetical protein